MSVRMLLPALLVSSLYPSAASACSCDVLPLPLAVQRARVIVVGTVTGMRLVERDGALTRLIRTDVVVWEGLKNAKPKTRIVVYGAVDTASCVGYDFAIGRDYLIFAEDQISSITPRGIGAPPNSDVVFLCGATTELGRSPGTERLIEVRRIVARMGRWPFDPLTGWPFAPPKVHEPRRRPEHPEAHEVVCGKANQSRSRTSTEPHLSRRTSDGPLTSLVYLRVQFSMNGPIPDIRTVGYFAGPQDRLAVPVTFFAASVAGRWIAPRDGGVTAMRNDPQRAAVSELSYLDASKVASPAGLLSELEVLSAEGQRLGNIKGVVIDAAARRVRYLSVQLSSWLDRRLYLVEADQLAQIESERHALRLRVDLREEAVHGLDAAALREFSDDDLLAAMFPSRAA